MRKVICNKMFSLGYAVLNWGEILKSVNNWTHLNYKKSIEQVRVLKNCTIKKIFNFNSQQFKILIVSFIASSWFKTLLGCLNIYYT